MFLKHGANFPNKFKVVVPTGFEPVSDLCSYRNAFL